MALMSVAEASARVLAEATPLPAELVPLGGSARTGTDRRSRRLADAAAGSCLGHGRLCGAIGRCREHTGTPEGCRRGRGRASVRGRGWYWRCSPHLHWGRTPSWDGHDRYPGNTRCGMAAPCWSMPAPAKASMCASPASISLDGTILLRTGRRLSDRDVALAAAMNHPAVPVHRRPKIAVLATGDELVMPGTNPGPGEIVYSNGFATMALARREGGDVLDLGIVPDRIDETISAVRRARAANADILVTSGGASVGDHDLVQKALASEGLELSFWRVAMRPGRPVMHGRLGQHARAWPARESGLGLCVCDPVYGPADPSAGRTAGCRRAAGSRGARRRLARQ